MTAELPFDDPPPEPEESPESEPPGEPTDEALHLAAAHARDDLHARLLVMQLGLAARTHPDLVRNALAEVFDLSAYEAEARRIRYEMSQTRALAEELRALVNAVRMEMDQLEEQYDRTALKAVELNGKKK